MYRLRSRVTVVIKEIHRGPQPNYFSFQPKRHSPVMQALNRVLVHTPEKYWI